VVDLVVFNDEATPLTDQFRPSSMVDKPFRVTLRALGCFTRVLFSVSFFFALPLSTLSSHSYPLPVTTGNTFE
jgi:hypothetical protein